MCILVIVSVGVSVCGACGADAWCIVASAIATVFEGAIAGKTVTGREGYYFGGIYSLLLAGRYH
jgi:hypothetical protein